MKKLMGLLSVSLLSLSLISCGNSDSQSDMDSSTENSIANSNRSSVKRVNSNKYQKRKISISNQFPKKGDYQEQDGVVTTYLTSLVDIPDISSGGLKLTNIQYFSTLVGKLYSQEISNYISSGTKAVFDKNSSESEKGNYAVVLFLETDLTNTTDQTVQYNGLSGDSGGENDWTTSANNNQIIREDTSYTDDTNVSIQSGKTIEDKDLTIVLSTGKTATEAVSKIPSGTLNIKTAAIQDSDYNEIGSGQAIKLKFPHQND
jgi:hypothetical protein